MRDDASEYEQPDTMSARCRECRAKVFSLTVVAGYIQILWVNNLRMECQISTEEIIIIHIQICTVQAVTTHFVPSKLTSN